MFMFPLPPTPTAPHEIWSVDSQEIFEIVTTRCQILRQKCTKFDFGWGSAPDPAGGAYTALPQTSQLDLRCPSYFYTWWKMLTLICLYCLTCTKFGQLILRKIFEIVTTRCQILRLKCTKFDFGWGSAPDPDGEAYSATPDPLAGFKGSYL